MTHLTVTKTLLPLTAALLAAGLSLSGCRSPQDHKQAADETVYAIIDQKWDPDYGSKVNFRISDTDPLPEDLAMARTLPPSGMVTLPRAVALATAHNRLYQAEKEALYIKALDLRLARHLFDPQFHGGAAGGYTKDGTDETVGAAAGIGLNQLLTSGARLSTDLTVAWVDVLTGNLRSGLTTLMNATITQPLLRGSDSRIVLENLTQAERETVYQIRSFNRFRQNLAVSVISDYYRVLQQFDRLQNARRHEAVLTQVHERAGQLAAFGRLPSFELHEAQQDQIKARDARLQAARRYAQALDDFKLSLSLPATADFRLDPTELTALTIMEIAPTPFTREGPEPSGRDRTVAARELELLALLELELEREPDEPAPAAGTAVTAAGFSESAVIQTALSLRLDLANQADAVADAERKVTVAADNLRAELNLTAGTHRSSAGSDQTAAVAGLELDLPLERMAEANDYRKALIVLTQQQRAYEEAVDTVALQVRRAYRNFTEAAGRHAAQTQGLALAQKRFQNTFLLLRYGRADTRDVLDAQEDLFDAQNAATDAMVDHTIAMLEFYRDTGVLQIRPDGMWKL